MFLTISDRAHLFTCNAASKFMLYTQGQAEEAEQDERELVRQAITQPAPSKLDDVMARSSSDYGVVEAAFAGRRFPLRAYGQEAGQLR
jgi:hypothetical protein